MSLKKIRKLFSLYLFIGIIISIFYSSCTKFDSNSNNLDSQSSSEIFLKTNYNVSPELKLVLNELRNQLNKNDFASQFIGWHGLPKWGKAIKLNKNENNYSILIIPTFKNAEIASFIAASIFSDGKVKFELHRQTSIINNIPEYSYVGIDRGFSIKIFSILNFSDKEEFKSTMINSGSNSNSYVNNECQDCWFEYEICSNNASFIKDSITQNSAPVPAPYCWYEHCYTWPGCDPTGGGSEPPPTGGGGGGCSNCPPPPDCPDPLWYSFVPIENPCDNEPPTPTIHLTPCELAVIGCLNATNIFNQQAIQNRKLEATTGIQTATKEKMFIIGKTSPQDVNFTPSIVVEGPDLVNVPASWPGLYVYGGAHTHTPEGFNAPSAGDVYLFMQNYANNSSFEYLYTFAQGQNDYVFTITSPVKFANFTVNWPATTYFDPSTGDWKVGHEIFEKSDEVYKYFRNEGKTEDEAFELAQAFIANKYQMGFALSKRDNNGNFKPIYVKEIPDPANPNKKIYQQTIECNLNKIITEL